MKLLLDTHTLIWLLTQPKRIPSHVADAIKAPSCQVFVSAATAWEIAIKERLGKLAFDRAFLAEFDERLRGLAMEPLAITTRHAITAASLPGSHKDPYDRLLAAQATLEGMVVVTVDRAFASLGAEVMW